MGYRNADPIIETAIKAMTGMMKEYSSKWTNNYPWEAPEYLFTVAIAQALVKKELGRVYPESNMKWSIGDSRPEKKNRLKRGVPKLARSDIMVADMDDKSFRFCIEVKKHSSSVSHIRPDLERCAKIISSTDPGTVDDAIVIFFRRSEKTKDSRKKLSEFIKTTLVGEGEDSRSAASISKLKEDGFRLTPYIGKFQTYAYEEEEYDWVVGAVRISMPKKRSR